MPVGKVTSSVGLYRLDHQPLFGKGARAPPPKGGTQTRHERAAEIEHTDCRDYQILVFLGPPK